MTDQLRNPNTSSSPPTPAVSSPQAGPQRCSGGCGFFGSAKTENLCSKCFKKREEKLNKENPTNISTSPESSSSVASNDTETNSLNHPLEALELTESSLEIVKPVTTEIFTPQTDEIIPPVEVSPPIVASSSPITPPTESASAKKPKNRCQFCSKKVGLTYFACKCDDSAMFCVSHRYPHSHNCSFDHQSSQKDKLAKNNPLVTHDKMERI